MSTRTESAWGALRERPEKYKSQTGFRILEADDGSRGFINTAFRGGTGAAEGTGDARQREQERGRSQDNRLGSAGTGVAHVPFYG